jgi:hypothetical protein
MLAGAFVTALGILALIFQNGIRYTAREKIPGSGSQVVVITHEEKYLTVPPLVAAAVLAGGVTMMVLAARR